MTKTIPATLIAGDGIGPEIMQSVTTVMDALDAPFLWTTKAQASAPLRSTEPPSPRLRSIVSAVLALC